MRLIGISGKARSGKDTIADWFCKNRDARRMAFADPIKFMIQGAFALDDKYFTDPVLKEREIPQLGHSPRYLAQTLGTEWGRTIVHPDVWVRALEMRLQAAGWNHPAVTIVISDVRFENEAMWVRGHGTLLHVSRPGADGAVGLIGHASEQGITYRPGDVQINNDGSLEELFHRLNGIFPNTERAAA